MKFGERIRQLRQAKGMTLRDLAPLVGVGFTYLSKVENGRLDFGEYPSDGLIRRLAEALEADEEELFVLAERVPDRIRRRVLQRPDAFGKLASLDDKTLDAVLVQIGEAPAKQPLARRKAR
jgi:transcriptional regulator with XRE-family HTH domain